MENFFQNVWQMIIDSHVLTIVKAIVILAAGWLIAIYVSGLVSRLIRNSSLEQKLNRCLPEGSALPASKLDKYIGRAVYILILLFTVLGCLTALDLSQAAAPIQKFFDMITAYAANLIGAAILIFIAWLCATLAKYLVGTAMKTLSIDQKTTESLELSESRPVSATVAEIIYWVVLLFFLPAILRTLKIEGITEPLQQMFTKLLEYVPNLIGAAAILFVGLLAARIVRKTVSGLVVISSLDSLGEKAGISKMFGNHGLSGMIGIVAYILIAIPVLISSLSALKIDSLSNSVSGLFSKILNATGDILGASLLLFVAVMVGKFVASLVSQLLDNFGFNKLLGHLGVKKDESNQATLPSALAGKIVFIAIILHAAIAACNILQFAELAALLQTFLIFGGNIVVGLIVLLIGFWLANFAADALKGKCNKLVVTIVKVCVLIFTGAIAIHNMEIGGPIVQTAFTLLLGAVCVALALAFGLGGREFAARKYEEWSKKNDHPDW
ncbi:MAG: mechanosensitive ion channel [Lentisphaeria bacterium]